MLRPTSWWRRHEGRGDPCGRSLRKLSIAVGADDTEGRHEKCWQARAATAVPVAAAHRWFGQNTQRQEAVQVAPLWRELVEVRLQMKCH